MKLAGTTLTKGTDYTVAYTNNVNAGTAKVTVTGIDNYSDTATAEFTINKKALSDCTVTVDDAYYVGTATDLKVYPKVTVKNGNVTLTEGTDYTTDEYKNNTSMATSVLNASVTDTSSWTYPQVIITAVDGGNYSGSAKPTFEIDKLDITSSDVTINTSKTEYTGKNIDPYDILKLSVTYNSTTTELKGASDGTGDYTITVLDSTGAASTLKDMGVYNLIITGTNNCENSITMQFTVTERSLSNNYHYYYYDGAFVGNWDYSSSLSKDNDGVTKGYICKGGLKGDSLTITVYDKTSVTEGSDNVPTVSILDSEVTVNDSPYQLVEGTDFTVSVSNATTSGTAAWNKTATTDYHATVASSSPAVTITGMGNYKDSITLPFNIGTKISDDVFTITYTVGSDTYKYDEDYDNPSTDTARWQYTYNGVAQKPTVVGILPSGCIS